MAEVLSQSQIDALVSAMRQGGEKLMNESDTNAEVKYRLYDFSSPKKFTKDRIKMLNSIFENYARIINTRLNTRLRTTCEVVVESVEEQHYYEFSNALMEGDVLTLAGVTVRDRFHEEPVPMYLSKHIALSMMDRLMGGDGSVGVDQTMDYGYSDLELRLYEELIGDMISVLANSWKNYVPIQFSHSRTDVNPTMSQILGVDEVVIIIGMRLKFTNCEGRMSICFPSDLLISVFEEIDRENPIRRVSSEKKADEILDNLRDSELEISATLGTTELLLSDIFHLNVGDVIDIGTPKDSPIQLEIGGYPWYNGAMGSYKKSLAVKIETVYYKAE